MTESPAARRVTLLVPGSLATRTGGYGYDRDVLAGLRGLGWTTDVRELDGSFPFPTPAAREDAVRALAALPDDALVIADGLGFGALPDEAAREARRLRLIALVHHPLAEETGLDLETSQRLKESERRALKAARLVVVTSPATGRRMPSYGVDGDRVRVIVPGTPNRPVAKGTGHHVALLCIATLIERKGHHVLLDALATLRDLPWQLTCYGSHTLQRVSADGIVAHGRSLGLDDRIRWAGEADEATLWAAYDAADVFVLPTLHEGYGMVVAEAVACGLPVVSTRVGGIPDLVSEDSGILVEPGDAAALAAALRVVVGDPAARARLRAGARERRETLTRWPDAIHRWDSVLREA